MVCCCKWRHVQMTMQKGWNSSHKNGKLDMELQASLCTGSSSWAALPATPSTSRRVWRRGGFRRFAISACRCPPCCRWATSRARRTASRVLLRCSCWARGLRCCMTVSDIIIFSKKRQSFGHPSHVGDQPMSQTRNFRVERQAFDPYFGISILLLRKEPCVFFFCKNWCLGAVSFDLSFPMFWYLMVKERSEWKWRN